jgi:hypothetical protein
MNWNALKNYKCPKDGAVLKDIGHYHACTKCIFSINKEKFDSIVSDKYTKRREPTQEEKLSELNNLGRKEVSESFFN